MEIFEAWNIFETTGKVEDYLNYRSQSKDMINVVHSTQTSFNQVGGFEHGRANSINGDGNIGHANW